MVRRIRFRNVEGNPTTVEQLREEALLLSASDRVLLVQDLIGSLETLPSGEGISPSWLEEIVRRSDGLHRGEMTTDHWPAPLARVRERLAEKLS